MDACPLLITSIVAVKPEDQGSFFQDFFGLIRLSLLRTRNAQNHKEAQRLALPAVGWERGLPVETGKTQSREKAQKNAARTPSRLHALLDTVSS
jgi:hypothetical protein